MAFEPDWAVHPGEILLETLQHRGMSQVELHRQGGWSVKHINQVVRGKVNVTVAFAVMLEDVLKRPPAQFWMNLQARWEIHTYRHGLKS